MRIIFVDGDGIGKKYLTDRLVKVTEMDNLKQVQ
jgi:hypothetical protein